MIARTAIGEYAAARRCSARLRAAEAASAAAESRPSASACSMACSASISAASGSRFCGASRQTRSAPACNARTHASPSGQRSLIAAIPSASVMIGPLNPAARSRSVDQADTDAGSGPSAGTTTWAVITESIPVAANGASSRRASSSAGTSTTAAPTWLSLRVSPCPG